MEKGNLSGKEIQLFEALQSIKRSTDEQLMRNQRIMENESYFSDFVMQLLIKEMIDERKLKLDFPTAESIGNLISNEYLNQYYGRRA
jgi:type I restriction enzyme R subunit